MKVYLDNAATTKLSDSVKNYVCEVLDCFGNPSSQYEDGKKTKQIIESARNNVANFINTNPKNIIFTSGGSASNTLAIKGYVDKNDCTVFYSAIAHKSILKCVEAIDNKNKISVGSDGLIYLVLLEEMLRKCSDSRPFVIIEYANSEIGTIQYVKEIVDLVHNYKGIIYVDCTGSISSIPIDVKKLGADMIGFSGHKIHALKGCGVLYKKREIKISPLIYGAQEHGLFAGTENILGIASIGKAVEDYDYMQADLCMDNRNYVLDYMNENMDDFYLVGSKINRLPNNLFVCFKGVDGEQLMSLLDLKGIQVSTGSACNSGKKEESNTLKEIRMRKRDSHNCIRMTFSGDETITELKYVCICLKECINTLREFA